MGKLPFKELLAELWSCNCKCRRHHNCNSSISSSARADSVIGSGAAKSQSTGFSDTVHHWPSGSLACVLEAYTPYAHASFQVHHTHLRQHTKTLQQ
jgi:hypothetical protein